MFGEYIPILAAHSGTAFAGAARAGLENGSRPQAF